MIYIALSVLCRLDSNIGTDEPTATSTVVQKLLLDQVHMAAEILPNCGRNANPVEMLHVQLP